MSRDMPDTMLGFYLLITLFLGDDEETEPEAGAASAVVSESVANLTACDVVVYLPKLNMNHAANEREFEKIVKAMTEFGEIVKQVINNYISF